MTLDDKDVHIWLTNPERTQDSQVLKTYRALLSPHEQSRHDRFRFARHRHDFLVSHALVRNTLSFYAPIMPADWQFVCNEHGRPEIANPRYRHQLRFNLAHTNGLVAVGITHARELGVDVESFDRPRINLNVARRYFATTESDALFALPKPQREDRFLRLWTLKESYIKAKGMGLALPLREFAFTHINRTPRIRFSSELDDDPSRWQFFVQTVGSRHLLALSAQTLSQEKLNLRIRRFPPPGQPR